MRAPLAYALVAVLGTAAPAAAQRSAGEELDRAIDSGDLAKVRELVEGGASPDTPIVYDEHSTTPLIKASREGHLEIVKYLLAKGADVNARSTIADETALAEAVTRGYDDVVATLIRAGADVKARSGPSQSSPLGLALFNGGMDVAEQLVAAGADPDEEQGYGITPLIGASSMCNPDVIRWLVGKGADVNKVGQKEYGGSTALITAARTGQPECVRTLLELGANPHLKMKDGGTALSAAPESKNPEVLGLLEAAAKAPAPKAAAPKGPAPRKSPAAKG